MELFSYLLKVSACSMLFFSFYLLVLRNFTFFKINRFYLLFSLLLSFVIPSLQFTIEREVASSTPIEGALVAPGMDLSKVALETPIVVSTGSAPYAQSEVDWYALLPYLYGGIVAGLLLLTGWRVYQLLKHTGSVVKEINGLKVVTKQSGFTNCSFFNYVFVDEKSLTKGELVVLLAHEEVHARQYHSVDKLLLMVVKAVLWFNPIMYLYDKALEQAHEYEADEATSQQIGTETYATLLLNLAVAKSANPLIHNFVKSPIKQRIKMLFNSKSKNMKKLAYLLALPIGLILIWGFTVDVVNVFPKGSQDKDFTLVIDAGHGGKDKGAVVDGVSEKEIALLMSKKLKVLAEEKGIKVMITRANDSYMSLKDRASLDGSFLISLHVNSAINGNTANGVEMFVSPSSDRLKDIRAMSMTFHLYKNLKSINGIAISNKPKQKKLYVLENSKMPGVTLELGYLTNKNDFQFITNEQKQNELAKAIIEGVLNYRKNSKSDEEIKAMQKEVDRISADYAAWKRSDKYKLNLAKAAKIRQKTLTGKIESLHYFSVRNILDGFILNVDGERYRVYLTKEQLKHFNLAVGDPISVKASETAAWIDSEYPVIQPKEIKNVDKISSTSPKPMLHSSSTLTVDQHTKLTYVKDGVMSIFDGELKAEEIEIDTEGGLVTAKNARFKKANGKLTSAALMKFNTRTGGFSANYMTKDNSAAFELISKLKYEASDSVTINRVMGSGIILSGNIKLAIDNYTIKGRIVSVNAGSNVLTAHLGSLKKGNGPEIKYEKMEFDLLTKETKYSN
ncbi:M56/M15 family metallopeptidase [Pedobacter insulae]|uniref:N-acetylmuramoyl-L-alanine amidase n=1 Tax=Pedobacter insulae TaxID=414048 RepID=A0A1I2TKL5_9SPHI|nr:M56/M15 family metallopeptidase [Pedobacter insulae]SFG63016.1 N-acetylmuramoyl-L-alanine amidase [Pedobacter insulae]